MNKYFIKYFENQNQNKKQTSIDENSFQNYQMQS